MTSAGTESWEFEKLAPHTHTQSPGLRIAIEHVCRALAQLANQLGLVFCRLLNSSINLQQIIGAVGRQAQFPEKAYDCKSTSIFPYYAHNRKTKQSSHSEKKNWWELLRKSIKQGEGIEEQCARIIFFRGRTSEERLFFTPSWRFFEYYGVKIFY